MGHWRSDAMRIPGDPVSQAHRQNHLSTIREVKTKLKSGGFTLDVKVIYPRDLDFQSPILPTGSIRSILIDKVYCQQRLCQQAVLL